MPISDTKFSSRAGAKLDFALSHWQLSVTGAICADLGCSTGGFTSCLLSRGATKVYAVDTGYGVLDYKLRIDSRVVVKERTNALHVTLDELMDFICVDVGWTPQRLILPHALQLLRPGGKIVSLLKPHYETATAHVDPARAAEISQDIALALKAQSIAVVDCIVSPVLGEKAHNTEYLLLIEKPE